MIESSFKFTRISSKNKPILIASGHEFYFKRQNEFTENWICSKYQTHKCRATAITKNKELIETRGEHNLDISAGQLEARNVIKHIKDLSDRFSPTVADDLATQFALPSKDKLIRTPARTRKQLDVNMPPMPVARKFEIPETFENFIRYDSGSNDHERIWFILEGFIENIGKAISFWFETFH